MTTNPVGRAAPNSTAEALLKELDPLFYPKSIAVVGVSSTVDNNVQHMFLKPLLDFGFPGPIYPVHPKGGEVFGLKIYPKIEDLPGPVDYVMGGIPARFTSQMVRECGKKGIKGVHFFTAGFSETGTKEGIELEQDLVTAGREAGVRIIGPNCMGIYSPEARTCFWTELPSEPGPVGFVCQSGGNSIQLIKQAAPRGVRFSKVISYGNACDLNECDFLEYLTHDPKTEIIAIYIEGTRDGQRFVNILSEAARKKPVVLLKGGVTEGGTKAAASHTGSLAGTYATWEALCRQLGVIQVHSMEELTDMIVTLMFMSVPRGRNVAIMSGGGGGQSVLATDDCERYGLKVPALPQEIVDRLLEFTPQAGNSVKNPIDSNLAMFDSRLFADTARIVSEWEGIDFMIAPLRQNSFYLLLFEQRLQYPGIAKAIIDAVAASVKPAAVVVAPDISPEMSKESFSILEECVSRGFPTYPSVTRAARAISTVIAYKERKNRS